MPIMGLVERAAHWSGGHFSYGQGAMFLKPGSVRGALLLLFWLGEQAEFGGPNRCLGAVRDPELGDDALYVGFDRGQADLQVLRYLPVRLAQGEQAQYLEFSSRK